jgi:hypothetical protein
VVALSLNAAHNFIQEILVCTGSTAPIWRR